MTLSGHTARPKGLKKNLRVLERNRIFGVCARQDRAQPTMGICTSKPLEEAGGLAPEPSVS